MKKVLVISYYFPPNAGSHVQRIAKFAKYLPDFGYEPIVLTSKIKTERIDEKLSSELSHIKKYYSLDLSKFIPGEIKKSLSRVFQPDKITLWRLTAVRKALKIIRKENIDLIFVSLPPHSVGYLASIIAQKANPPLVVDFRDEWITFPLFENKKHHILQKRMYHKMLNRVQGCTTVNKTLKNRITKNSMNKSLKLQIIFNGFDTTDIPKNIRQRNSKKIRMIYNGRFKTISDPTEFFKIFSKLFRQGILNPQDFELIIAGKKTNNKKWFKDFPELLNISTFTDYLDLKKIYQKLAEADIGLIFLTNYGKSSAFPLKMFDYIGLEKPIIAFLEKKDELYRFLKSYKASKIFTSDNKNLLKENAEEFIEFINEVKKGNVTINPQYKKAYNRKFQAKALSNFFDKILQQNDEN